MVDDYGIERRPEHDDLPGRPPKKLLRDVRGFLWRRLRARPHRIDECWRAAWQWAAACSERSNRYLTLKRRYWPPANEIASQYLLLVLTQLRDDHQLRLPMHAGETIAVIAGRFPGLAAAAAPQLPPIIEKSPAALPAPQRAKPKADRPTPLFN
jgi:hypothetical protein